MSSISAYELGTMTSTVELESINYASDINTGSDEALYQGSLSAKYMLEINDNSRIVATPKLRVSNYGGIKDDSRFNEAFIDWRFNNSDIRAGVQTYSWGRTDIVNPIDFSSGNFQDPLDDDNEDIGQLSLSRRSYHQIGDVEILWIPTYYASELPAISSPWFPSLPQQSDLGQVIQYQLQQTSQPDIKISNSQFGIRLTGHNAGFDFGVSYFSGWNDLPIYLQKITSFNADEIIVNLEPNIYRVNIFGLEGATSLGSYTIRTELAYIDTHDDSGINPLIDDSYYHGVIGLDTKFNDAMFNQDISAIVEWSYQHSKTEVEYNPSDLDHIFENTVFMRFSTDQSPSWEAKLDLAYDLQNDGSFIRPSFNAELVDDFKVSIMLEWMQGDDDSFFGTFKDNKAIRIRFSKDNFLF